MILNLHAVTVVSDADNEYSNMVFVAAQLLKYAECIHGVSSSLEV